MILADTSTWVDHMRSSEYYLAKLLSAGAVLFHPIIIGEIALSGLRHRARVLDELRRLPTAAVATDREVLRFIDDHLLSGRGFGFVDAHLLSAVRLSAGAPLRTRDKRFFSAAQELTLAVR